MTTSILSPRLYDPFLGYFCFQKQLQLKITKLGGFCIRHLFYLYLILLRFALLHDTGVVFLQMEDKASTSKKITIRFTEKLTLLQHSLYCGGLEPSLHYLRGMSVHT